MTTQTAVQTAPVPPSQWQLFAATFFRNKGAVLGLVVLIIMVISALLAPCWRRTTLISFSPAKSSCRPLFSAERPLFR